MELVLCIWKLTGEVTVSWSVLCFSKAWKLIRAPGWCGWCLTRSIHWSNRKAVLLIRLTSGFKWDHCSLFSASAAYICTWKPIVNCDSKTLLVALLVLHNSPLRGWRLLTTGRSSVLFNVSSLSLTSLPVYIVLPWPPVHICHAQRKMKGHIWAASGFTC